MHTHPPSQLDLAEVAGDSRLLDGGSEVFGHRGPVWADCATRFTRQEVRRQREAAKMSPVTGGGHRRLDTYFARGILKARATLFLTVRVVMRFIQFVQPTGAASEGADLWRAALPAFVLLDVLVWRALRRSDGFGLAWRLPLDCADMAFWALSPLPASGRYDWAILTMLPLAIEAGLRCGWGGLAVPGAAAAVAGVVLSLSPGRALYLGHMGWLVIAVVMGMAMFGYCRRLYDRADAEHRRRLAAERRQGLPRRSERSRHGGRARRST